MFWKCLVCGFDKNSDPEHSNCQSCTCNKPINGISIKSKKTVNSYTLKFNIDKPELKKLYGTTILQILADPDIKFVSDKQFYIWKTADNKAMISSAPEALNPLYYNSLPIPDEGIAVEDGGTLSIKNRFFFLDVKLD